MLANVYTPNWSEKVILIKTVKHTEPRTYVINDFNREEIVCTFKKKELQTANQKEFRIQRVINPKLNKLLLNGKVMIIRLIVG